MSKSLLERDFTRFAFHDAGVLTQTVLARALAPACPVDIRNRGVQLIDRLVAGLLSRGPNKLIPFSKRHLTSEQLCLVDQRLRTAEVILNASAEQISLLCASPPSRIVAAGPIIIPLLLSGLDDSSDMIRCSVANSLCAGVHFLLPDSSVTATSSSVRYSTVCTTLLGHATRVFLAKKTLAADNGDRDEFTDAVDLLLRTAACLDPALFEQLVREQLSALMVMNSGNGQLENRDAAIGFLSELVSHCDIMSQLNQARPEK